MIYSFGLDWEHAPIDQREYFSVSDNRTDEFLQKLVSLDSVRGCVLLQTCNRFELYFDTEVLFAADAFLLKLREYIGYPADKEFPELLQFSDEEAHRRLMEISSGLKSQILGEDQIITQVRQAIKRAREAKVTTPELETLFRIAVTAGKAVRTQVRMQKVPSSTAHKAVEIASEQMSGLSGKRALVIGNGTIGRLAANLLVEAGAEVTITLRTYKHGETIVPTGCATLPYEERYDGFGNADVVMSATKSPHFTILESDLRRVDTPPSVLIDMAIPRDIDPECRAIEGVKFFDMDDLYDSGVGEGYDRQKASEIIEKYLSDFEKWYSGRLRHLAASAHLAIFAGTTEGRNLCQALSDAGMTAKVFVATEYGSTVLPDFRGIEVHAGRLNEVEMKEALSGITRVVDATHPYATEVSKNIRTATKALEAEYIRLVRPETGIDDQVIKVSSAQEAAAYLAQEKGAILLTTGAKDLALYTSIPDFEKRVHPRILPDPDSLKSCVDLGYARANIVCMQGPFSLEMNLALIESTKAQWLVTKDSGNTGGMVEKLNAAEQADIKVVMITRPQEPVEGKTYEEVRSLLIGERLQIDTIRPLRFPLFIDMVNLPCLIVGAGTIGTRRLGVLKDFGADITVIDPHISTVPEGVMLKQRNFVPGDTEGMSLVVAATNNREVNHEVYAECRAKGIPISVADSPEESAFFFPAICKSTHMCAGLVSTGEDHALVARTARALRKTMEEIDI